VKDGGQEAGGGEEKATRDTESKARTPHKDVGKKDNPFLQSKPVGRVRVNLLMERGTKSSTNRELNMGHPTEGLHLTVPSLASRDLQTQLWMVYIGSQKTALECLGNP